MATIVGDKIIIPMQGVGNDIKLVALDISNGLSKWEVSTTSPHGGADSILADQEQVYIVLPFVVKAYSISDGKEMWTTQELDAHTGYTLLPAIEDDTLLARSNFKLDKFTTYSIDKKRGEITSTTSGRLMEQLRTDEATYYSDSDFGLSSIDKNSQVRWRISTSGSATGLELINSQILILLTGSYLTSLAGIEPSSGNVIWKIPGETIASNFIVIDNTIYTIRNDATITAHDAFTGQEIGQLKFGGGPLDVNHAAQYWLIARNSMIFVYLGDSHELIAFSRK